MIFTDRKITIRNGKSSINEPVILYRGDFEVSIKFTIMESKFRFKSGVNLVDSEKASHGQLAILAPYGGNVFSEIVKCEDGTVTFTLTKEMIDQLEEVGLYSFQIRLFDYYRESRVSIPPVEFGIEVREPVASEDHDNEVNNAIVGYSIAKVVDGLNEDVPDTFDANGQYNKTDWETGDRISEGKLNKIEDAIDKINQNEKNDAATLDKRVTNNFNTLNATKADKNDIFSMANMGQDIKEAMTGGSVAVVGKNAILTENIMDKQVTRGKTSYMSLSENGNLLSTEVNVTRPGFMYTNTGAKLNGDYPNLKLTLNDIDFINIPIIFNMTSYVTFWDTSDSFISGYIQGSLDNGTNTARLKNIPSNAYYVLFGFYGSRLSDAVVAKASVYKNGLKPIYLDAGLTIQQENLDSNIKLSKNVISDIEIYPYGNLLAEERLSKGGYYNTSGSYISAVGSNSFECEIDPSNVYRFNFTSHITYWDVNKTFISGYIQGSLDNGTNVEPLKNIPSNARYVRMLIYDSRLNNSVFALSEYFKLNLKTLYWMPNFVSSEENMLNTMLNNTLAGKKAIFFGDSWCAGNDSAPGGWCNIIKSNNPTMTVYNCGRHGADWSQCYSYWFSNVDNYISLPDDADYIIIEAYTNGLYGAVQELSKPLGEINQYQYYSNIDEITNALGSTYAADLEKCLFSIVKRWNGKKIGLMFPYKAVSHLSENNAFRNFREQVIACANKYNIPIFDNFNGSNIQSWNDEYVNKYYWNSDKTHLNGVGYAIITPPIEHWMRTL